MIFLPILSCICLFETSYIFRDESKEAALAHLEKQFKANKIDLEHYKEMYRHIEMFELEKKKVQAEVIAEKERLNRIIEKEAETIISSTIQNLGVISEIKEEPIRIEPKEEPKETKTLF